jgi:Ca2+-binding EF-hand superfamily protein
MKKLSANETAAIRKRFDKYDTDENETIGWDEFCLMIDELDSSIDLTKKTHIFDKVDKNHTGMVSFSEFLEWWQNRD